MTVASFGFAVRFPMVAGFSVMIAAVTAVASLRLAVIAVAAPAMTLLGLLDALGPSFFSALNLGPGFRFLLFAHVVPAISQRVRRAFPMGRTAGASLRLPMSIVRRSSMLFSQRAIGAEGNDADYEE